jgi:hypothetical protein
MTLAELIASEPSIAQAVTDGNDGLIAQWLNTPSIERARGIPINAFAGELYNSGAFVAIVQAAATGNTTAQMAITIMEKAKALGIETIDLSLTSNQSLLSALLADGVITQAQIDSALALGTELVSPAEYNGLGSVSAQQIAEWRSAQ